MDTFSSIPAALAQCYPCFVPVSPAFAKFRDSLSFYHIEATTTTLQLIVYSLFIDDECFSIENALFQEHRCLATPPKAWGQR